MKIRNLVNMFELKALKQAYYLTRLQNNTYLIDISTTILNIHPKPLYKLPKPNLIILGLIP
jgi:hypothetical protein